ncbi:hypothetical protein UlMin_027865 [Ulmus minor]
MICAHGLSKLLLSYERQSLFKGVRIAPACLSISYLFFADDSLIFCRARIEECTNIKSYLDCYSKASRQSINFKKSALSVSPNTTTPTKENIFHLFGVLQVGSHDLYLGLPTFSMRNKILQFGYLRDRVVKKLQGWKERFYSQGGKKVLLKYVIQAIPTYTISCLITPDTILKEIEAACARFWWGTTPDHKRIQWKK